MCVNAIVPETEPDMPQELSQELDQLRKGFTQCSSTWDSIQQEIEKLKNSKKRHITTGQIVTAAEKKRKFYIAVLDLLERLSEQFTEGSPYYRYLAERITKKHAFMVKTHDEIADRLREFGLTGTVARWQSGHAANPIVAGHPKFHEAFADHYSDESKFHGTFHDWRKHNASELVRIEGILTRDIDRQLNMI